MILQLVTDRRRLPASTDGDPLRQVLWLAEDAIAAGVDVLQVRERDLDAADQVALVRGIVAAARGTRTRVVVNDRVDVAIVAGAAGVHLRGDSIAAADARHIAPPGFLIGQSVHSVKEAVAAAPHVDYFVAGTVWATASKDSGHQLLGPEGFAAIVNAVPVPTLGIGGVTLERLGALAAAGAAGFAAIGYFLDDQQAPGDRAGWMRARVDAARARFDTHRRAS